MKTLKPLMLVLAGMAIALLVSFKSQEPIIAKEYCKIKYQITGKAIFINYGSKEEKMEVKLYSAESEAIKLLNSLSTQGWNVKSMQTSISTVEYDIILLERTKQ